MDYLLLTEQQFQKRFDLLSDNLKEVISSENNIEIVRRICQDHHLVDEEKLLIIKQLVGLILLGFVSLNDFRQEIMNNIHLNYQHSNDIAKEIYEKIFAPIRSEIDKIYSPVGILAKESAPVAEVKEKKDTIDLRIFEKQKSEEEVKKPAESEKEIKKEIVEKPAEIKKELPAVPLPSETISKIEIEPVGPVIIHKEIETKPTLGKQRSLGGLFGFLKAQKKGEKIQEQKPITAEVEIPILELPKPFDTAQGKPPVMSKVESPKVVHYSDFKTSLSVPMPPKPEIKSDSASLTTSKIFESEIEKAKAAGLIVNNLQPKIDEIPIEIEEVSKQSFFSKIFQFFAGLFVTKKKVIKEVPFNTDLHGLDTDSHGQKTTLEEKIKKEIFAPLPPMPPKEEQPTLRRDSEREEFKFPIEIKLPEPQKKEPELSKPATPELKTDIFKTKELETPEIHPVLSRVEGEVREKPQPIIPQPALSRAEGPEKPKTQDEEIVDLRTFQKIKK